MERPSDEQILQFEQSIKAEEVERQPLVGPLEPRSRLQAEYSHGAGTESFREKIENLADYGYNQFRRCRGDGNCFYRAVAFAYLESLVRQPDRWKEARTVAQEHKHLLRSAGFEEFAFTDFFEEYWSVLEKLDSPQKLLSLLMDGGVAQECSDPQVTAEEALHRVLNDLMISNAIVVHFRFITSAYLKVNADMYAPFLDDGMTVEMYCNQQVEAMDRYTYVLTFKWSHKRAHRVHREADQIHIIALSKALNQGITVAYLDASHSSDQPTFHRFLPSDDAADSGQELGICLLYRPGHYDILYK